ncbi:MAG: hypothetical protein EON58_16270 [Alphaproteobacteria bacterium]|nr:MAG: hypothetical protein EON58_16270 [Alphaproteobacteria bacterium]
MFSKERIQALAPDVMLDIEVELAYWKEIFPNRTFFHRQHLYDKYIPTFKFGYDSYLRHHRQVLADVMPALERRYHAFREEERVDWRDASLIVGACWARMGSPGHMRPSK